MENKKTIYIADDDENIRDAIKTFLDSSGFAAASFGTGDELLSAFRSVPCDLVILDVMMPGSSGFEICAALREVSTVPIIILTARDSDLDYAAGLSLGSDDYFTKPFSAISLVMRVKSIFRRIEFDTKGVNASRSAEVRMYGDITMDGKAKTAAVKNKAVSLTPNEYSMLEYLVEHGGEAVSRDELLNHIWNCDADIETRATDDTVRRLRKKLADSNSVIEAVWGFGFRLKVRDE